MKLLVTGTGRCGTRFMAEWLTAAGIPCGHEQAFGYRGFTNTPYADASWLAVPYLGLVSCRIVHVVRHPLDVVRSFLGTHHFGPFRAKHLTKPWHRFMALHFGYTDEPPVQQAMRYWVEWNRRIGEYTTERYRIESLPCRDVMENLGGNPNAVAPARETNAHRHADLDRLPRGGWFDQVADLATEYGYDAAAL